METKKELTAQQKIFVIKRARTLMKLVSEIEIEFPGRDERDLKVMREGFATYGDFDSIGKELNLTRERVRQIFERSVKILWHRVRQMMKEYQTFDKVRAHNNSLVGENKILRRYVDEKFKDTGVSSDDIANQTTLFAKRITELDLSCRLYNCLKACGIMTIGEIISYKRSDYEKFRNLGVKSINELEEVVKSYSLYLDYFNKK